MSQNQPQSKEAQYQAEQLAVIAVNRFGLGATSNEIKQALSDPVNWLKQHLTPIIYQDDLPHSSEILKAFEAYKQENKKIKIGASMASAASFESLKKYPRDMLRAFSVSHVKHAVSATNSMSWRLLDFFSNHFSVTATGRLMSGLAATLEREAIAPNLFGTFEDMLIRVCQHPAMLVYLNNHNSFGVNSKAGIKRGKGMNENLAREILELHTLGVNGGYQQNDVIELAKAITGWSVNFQSKNKKGQQQTLGFVYKPYGHEPGDRELLGVQYRQKNIEQGVAMLKRLANHPKTIQHVCFKLARHFISDKPPKTLVQKLAATWQKSGGDLRQVAFTLIDAKESWQLEQEKFKTPREFILSTLRLIKAEDVKPKHLLYSFLTLGQKPFNAGSPAGYDDVKSAWDGGSALMARIDWASIVASKYKVSAIKAMSAGFAGTLSERTSTMVARAESQQRALTLLLLSPEFMTR